MCALFSFHLHGCVSDGVRISRHEFEVERRAGYIGLIDVSLQSWVLGDSVIMEIMSDQPVH